MTHGTSFTTPMTVHYHHDANIWTHQCIVCQISCLNWWYACTWMVNPWHSRRYREKLKLNNCAWYGLYIYTWLAKFTDHRWGVVNHRYLCTIRLCPQDGEVLTPVGWQNCKNLCWSACHVFLRECTAQQSRGPSCPKSPSIVFTENHVPFQEYSDLSFRTLSSTVGQESN